MQGRTVVIQQRVSSQCITKRKTCNYSRGFKCILCTENMDLIIALVEMIQIFKIRFKGINILWNLVKMRWLPSSSKIWNVGYAELSQEQEYVNFPGLLRVFFSILFNFSIRETVPQIWTLVRLIQSKKMR